MLSKALQRDQETRAPSPPPAAMRFLVLCLMLSLGEYGKKLRVPQKEKGTRLLPSFL